MPGEALASDTLRARVDALAREAVRLERAVAERNRLEAGAVDDLEAALLEKVARLHDEVSARDDELKALQQKVREARRGPERALVTRTFARRFFVLAGWLVPSAWLLSVQSPAAGLAAAASMPLAVAASRFVGRWAR
jgi:hypothetical protein